MMKDAIHGHNSVALGLHFLTSSSLLHVFSRFFFWFCTFLPSFACLFIVKEKKLPDQLAQASWLLAWANGTLKYCRNGLFSPSLWAWFLDLTNNHQNIRNAWMNLSYLNKNTNKCTIYKTIRFKGSFIRKYYNQEISANILIPKITKMWHLSILCFKQQKIISWKI